MIRGNDPMSRLTGNAWLADFDQTLQRYYAITCEDAGADGTVLQRYADMPAHQAAMAFAEDYDLGPLDWWSIGRVMR